MLPGECDVAEEPWPVDRGQRLGGGAEAAAEVGPFPPSLCLTVPRALVCFLVIRRLTKRFRDISGDGTNMSSRILRKKQCVQSNSRQLKAGASGPGGQVGEGAASSHGGPCRLLHGFALQPPIWKC